MASAKLAERLLQLGGIENALRIRLGLEQAWALSRAGEPASAVVAIESSIAVATEAGDLLLEGRARAALGRQLIPEDAPRAGRVLEEALAIHRELGDHGHEGITLMWAASVSLNCGDSDSAWEQLNAARKIFRALGYRRYEGKVHANQSVLARLRGWFDEAEDAAAMALAIHAEVGDLASRPPVLTNYAWLVSLRQGAAAGRPFLEEARALSEKLVIPFSATHAEHTLAVLDLVEGRTALARRCLRSVAVRYIEVGHPEGALLALSWRALAAALDGELERGFQLATEVVEKAKKVPRSWLRSLLFARACGALARVGEPALALETWSACDLQGPFTDRPIERLECLVYGRWVHTSCDEAAAAQVCIDEVETLMRRYRVSVDSVVGRLSQLSVDGGLNG